MSLCLGLTLPYLGNFICRTIYPDIATRAQVSAISRHGNNLLKLLTTTAVNEQIIAITLDSRKVYVGSVAVLPNLDPRDAFVGIIPLFSGFRDKDDLTLHWTVDYLRLYESENLPPEQFQVIVPIASIRSASLFDQSIYSYFVMGERRR